VGQEIGRWEFKEKWSWEETVISWKVAGLLITELWNDHEITKRQMRSAWSYGDMIIMAWRNSNKRQKLHLGFLLMYNGARVTGELLGVEEFWLLGTTKKAIKN